MANDLGISITAYSKIERGLTNISISRLESIADALGTSVLELLEPEYDQKHYQPAITNPPIARDAARIYGEYDTITLMQRVEERDQEISRLRKIIADKEEIISLLKEKIKE